jgi:hypothetical protein
MRDMHEASFKNDASTPIQTQKDDVSMYSGSFCLASLRRYWSKLRNLVASEVLLFYETAATFYFPQRLWIAFSVTNVGLLAFLVAYHFALKAFCQLLDSFRLQMIEFLSQSNSLIAAAPALLEVMTRTSVPESLRGAHFSTSLLRSK